MIDRHHAKQRHTKSLTPAVLDSLSALDRAGDRARGAPGRHPPFPLPRPVSGRWGPRSNFFSPMAESMSAVWERVTKFDTRACLLADRHYSRRKVGSPQFMPPGQTIVLLTSDERAVFGWWRPHPTSGLRAMNGLDGWTCTIFRNESASRSSDLILAAEAVLLATHDVGPDGMLTYVWDRKIASTNPGYCFKCAGWTAIGRSADGRKTLLRKMPLALELAA